MQEMSVPMHPGHESLHGRSELARAGRGVVLAGQTEQSPPKECNLENISVNIAPLRETQSDYQVGMCKTETENVSLDIFSPRGHQPQTGQDLNSQSSSGPLFDSLDWYVPWSFDQLESVSAVKSACVSSSSPSKTETCGICLDTLPESRFHTLSICKHSFCIACLDRVVSQSANDKKFPVVCALPDCGTPIDLQECETLVNSTAVVQTLRQLEDEHRIPASERFYCPHPSCSALMRRPSAAEDSEACSLQCGRCGRSSCVRCGVLWHEGRSCREFQESEASQSPEDRLFKRLAEEQEWTACPGCRRVVAKTAGCNHMTCLCGGQFCYACGAPWDNKGCSRSCRRHRRLRAQLERRRLRSVNRPESSLGVTAASRPAPQQGPVQVLPPRRRCSAPATADANQQQLAMLQLPLQVQGMAARIAEHTARVAQHQVGVPGPVLQEAESVPVTLQSTSPSMGVLLGHVAHLGRGMAGISENTNPLPALQGPVNEPGPPTLDFMMTQFAEAEFDLEDGTSLFPASPDASPSSPHFLFASSPWLPVIESCPEVAASVRAPQPETEPCPGSWTLEGEHGEVDDTERARKRARRE